MERGLYSKLYSILLLKSYLLSDSFIPKKSIWMDILINVNNVLLLSNFTLTFVLQYALSVQYREQLHKILLGKTIYHSSTASHFESIATNSPALSSKAPRKKTPYITREQLKEVHTFSTIFVISSICSYL